METTIAMARMAMAAATTADQLLKRRQRHGEHSDVSAVPALRRAGQRSHGRGEKTITREKSEPETKGVT